MADDSLHYHRSVMQRVYARARLPEYWGLALPEARVEVHRDPGSNGHRNVTVHRRGENVAPRARPNAQIAVDELLP